ncbi:MAG: hypothetical protein H0X37_04145 [Herpetosiphonaceae bacterium]|nr:hypothetical protein [Herpetosiphonaceae bacterium]
MMFNGNRCAGPVVSVRHLNSHGKPNWMRTLLVCSLLIAACAVSTHSSLAAGFSKGLDDHTIWVQGVQRTYHVHLPPSYTGNKATPLVVAIHAENDNGPNMAGLTHFNNVADSASIIAVYPDGINGNWNTDGTGPKDDFTFISAMIQQMETKFAINSHRIYVMGFSQGGIFSEEVGCRLGSTFTAVASVSGHMPSTFVPTCVQSHPMPFITFHGIADPIYSYAGWANTRNGKHLMGATDAEDAWAGLAHCKGQATTTNQPNTVLSDGTTEQLRTIGTCGWGAEMQLYIIKNGGHTWPSGLQYMPTSIVGLTSLDIDAGTVMWQFFARFHY